MGAQGVAQGGGGGAAVSVPVPVAAARVAFPALLNVTTMVSSASSSASPVTETSRVRVVVPGAKVSVPAASTA